MKLSKRIRWLVGAGITLLALVILGCVYRARLRLGLALLVEETGSRTMAAVCLVLGLFTAFSLVFWMLLPWFLIIGLKDLRRRTSELDESTQLCAQHLGRLADHLARREEKKMDEVT